MKWTVDASHSSVEFSVKHLMISTVKGRFKVYSGKVEFDEGKAHESKIDVNIDVSSVDTQDERRDGHLKSPEFFNTEKYPTITFRSTKVEKISDEEYKATGELTILDVTKEVVLDVEYAGQAKSHFGDNRAGFTAKTSINRKDFGLNWNVALEAGGVVVSDKVNISLDVELVEEVAKVEAVA